ncbi:MAG: zinc-ribbon domain-containing protein, partial [Tepidisphaeraceae bacterium]
DDEVCPSCGAAVYPDADQCPRCGHYLTHDQATRPAKWVIVAAIVCLAVILLFWIV